MSLPGRSCRHLYGPNTQNGGHHHSSTDDAVRASKTIGLEGEAGTAGLAPVSAVDMPHWISVSSTMKQVQWPRWYRLIMSVPSPPRPVIPGFLKGMNSEGRENTERILVRIEMYCVLDAQLTNPAAYKERVSSTQYTINNT